MMDVSVRTRPVDHTITDYNELIVATGDPPCS